MDGLTTCFTNKSNKVRLMHPTSSITRLPGEHGLSQQGVWVPFWTPNPLKRTPQDTQKFLCEISKKSQSQAYS